jgi:hypothetical protein
LKRYTIHIFFSYLLTYKALVSANESGGKFEYITTSTVGIVFLGTPHRGTKAARWGELIAMSGNWLGLGSEKSILQDLQLYSDPLKDLIYRFTLWLFRYSVPTVCFFEQNKTDYGEKFGLSWRELVSIHSHWLVDIELIESLGCR